MDEVLHVGFDLPAKEIYKLYEEDDGMPVQTIKFSSSITSSLESSGLKVTLISTQPTLNFPKNRNLLYGAQLFKKGKSDGVIIPFINVFMLKHFTRFISVFYYICVRSFFYSGKRPCIFVHGVHFPFIFAAYLAKLFFSSSVFVFVTDPPEVFGSNKIEIFLRRINEIAIYKLLNRMSGLIVLSELLYKDKKFTLPHIVLDGFLDQNVKPKVHEEIDSVRLKVGYAGLLSANYGVKNLVLAAIENKGIELHLFGRGDCESFIEESSRNFNNIIFHGFLNPDSLYDHLDDIVVMVNPRPVDVDFSKYSFPSKTIEYMAMGKMLVTTRIMSIGPEYQDYVLFIDGDSALSISNSLKLLETTSRDDIVRKAKLGMDFIRNTRSVAIQGQRIKDFMMRCRSV